MSQPTAPLGPTPDASIMKRLSYIRLFHRQAIEQSYTPPPLNFSSVLMFHDVTEYFFIVAIAHLGNDEIDLDQPFSRNVKKLRAPDGGRLSNLDVVRRVGDYRNGFKHGGSIPGVDQVEETRRDVTLFLESNCPRLFGVEFSDISLLHIVSQDAVRSHLSSGRSFADSGDIRRGMAELALAFDRLIDDWGEGKYLPRTGSQARPFEFSAVRWHRKLLRIEAFPNPSNPEVRNATKTLAASVKRAFDEVEEELESIRHVMRLQMAGIDMAGYARFAMLAPQVSVSVNGQHHVIDGAGEFHYTPENYDFCETFVVNSALRLGQNDFALWMPLTYGDFGRARAAMEANGGRLPDDMR